MRRSETPGRIASCAIGCTLALMSAGAAADSAVGVDTLLGNAFNTTGLDPLRQNDERPVGTFRQPHSHSPTGQMYNTPWLMPSLPEAASSDWVLHGSLDIGYWFGDGSVDNALYRMYKDPKNGLQIDYASFSAEQASTALYVKGVAGSVGRDDQYYGLEGGRYNDYRVRAFFNETPHTFTNANTYWQGVGSSYLALPPGLVPGNNTAAAIQQAVQNGHDVTLGLERKRFGARGDLKLDDEWSVFASYTQENRQGTRPFGGAFFFPLAFGVPVGGLAELAEPIDYRTHDVLAGLQYAAPEQQFNLTASGSFFRNEKGQLTFENPFNIGSAVPGNPNAVNFTNGQMDLYPDNDAYGIKAEYARAFPDFMHARLNATLSFNRMTQDDHLLAPTTIAGDFGAVPPYTNINDWNTTAALSQQRADARIDTKLADLSFSLSPATGLNVRAKARVYDTDNRTVYTAYNPLTGEFGYPRLSGAQGNIIPGEGGIYTGTQGDIHYRSIPFDGTEDTYSLDADYRLARNTTLTGGYERDNMHRHFRERDRTWEDRGKIGINDRSFGPMTVRLSYEYASKRGSHYNYDPYQQFYTESLPGYTSVGDVPHTLEEMRKYDLADRRQQVFNARVNYQLTEELDGMISAQHKINHYPASFGRVDDQRNTSVNFELNYSPTPQTTGYAFYSWDRGRLQQANVNDNALSIVGSPEYGVDVYPTLNAWSAKSVDRGNVFGLGYKQDFSNHWTLDLNLSFTRTSTSITYDYLNGGGAVLGDATAAVPDLGNAFPDLAYRETTLEASLLVPLSKNISTRWFVRYTRAYISDWHYLGLDNTLMPGAPDGSLLNQTWLDPGPSGYHNTLFGIQLQLRM